MGVSNLMIIHNKHQSNLGKGGIALHLYQMAMAFFVCGDSTSKSPLPLGIMDP